MPGPGAVATSSDPSAMATNCVTSDAGSGYITPPSTSGRRTTGATAGSAHWDSRRDGAASDDGRMKDGNRGGSQRQRPPSASTETSGSKAGQAVEPAKPTETEKVRRGGGGGAGGGAWQWMNNAGKRASGKLSRARRGVGGVGRRGSPNSAEGDPGRGDETQSLIGAGNDRISDFIGREVRQSRTPVEQRGKAFTTPITHADQVVLSDCSSSEELAEVGRSEMLAWATAASAAGRSGTGDGARPRPPARRKGRYRRTASSGSSREPRLVATPRSTTGGDVDGNGGGSPASGSTLETDVLADAEARRQAFGAEAGIGGGRNGEFQATAGEGHVEPALGKPATVVSASTSGAAAAWSWKTLALAKTSTASTSATSINSAAVGASCSPRSDVYATGSAGSGASGGRGGGRKDATVVVQAATAGCLVSSTSSPSAPTPAPAPAPTPPEGGSGAASTAKSTASYSSGIATGAPTAPVASGASGSTTSSDEKVLLDSGRGVNAAAAAAGSTSAGAVRLTGAPSSRPPPFPTSSTTRLGAKAQNPGGDGVDASRDDHADAQRYPMAPPSPSDSGSGRILSDASGAEGRRGRTGKEHPKQPEAMPTQQKASATADPSSVSAVTIQVDVDGSPNAGDLNCLDSAGGGSFEIEVLDNGGSAAAPTPNASTANDNRNNDSTEEPNKDDEGSDSLDSGFGSAASPGDSIGGMTEGEIVAAAEAAMSSAEKAAAGTAPAEHTPRSRLLLATEPTPFLHPAVPASATSGKGGEGADGGVIPARGGGISSGSASEHVAARDHGGAKSPPVVEQEGSGSSTRRTIRDDSWWREGAAKALAASADSKKTPARSRSGTPGRSRGAVAPRPPAAAGGATATSRGPKGTPSTRGGSRRGERAGGGGGAGLTGGGEGGSGGAAPSVPGGFLTPSRAAAATEVSPTFSTISSREQAERDRERLAAIAGNRGYRRSSWGVALPSAGNGDSNSVITGTPGGYGTDEGQFNAAGARSGRRGSRGSYHSLDSSGWGLTSDEGGDGESQSRRWRPSLTSSVRSGGGDSSGTGSSGARPTPSSSAFGSGASAAASVFSDDEGSSSSRSSISTGYESSAKGEDRGAADRTEGWSDGRDADAPPPSPPGDDSRPQDGDGSSPQRDNYPPPSPAGSPQTPVSARNRASSMNKLEKSALKKKAHYEKQANAAAGAAIAAAALAAAAGATAAAHRQSSHSFSEHSQGGSPRGNAGRRKGGRMPSETRAILSRGGSLPAFDVFHPRSTEAGRGHARHGSSGDVIGKGTGGKPVGGLSAWPRGQATSSKQAPLSRRVQSTVSEGSRPRHASVEEAIAMAVAWTPSQIQRGGGGGNSSQYSQGQQGGRGRKEDRGSSVGQQPGDGKVGAEGERVSGSGGRARDSQYFFSSRASSVRGMSPAGIVQDHQERHRNPSPAELRRAKSTSNKDDSIDVARNGRSGDSSRGRKRMSRRPLPTPPTPQDRQQQQEEQQRRRRAMRRERTASTSVGRRDREPLTIPPLPKVLFRPPVAGTPRHRNQNQPHQRKSHRQQQQRQQRQQRQQEQEQPPGARRNGIALGDAAGGGGGSGRGRERGGGGRGYFRSDPSRSIGDWPSFSGTPTSTSFSPSSAVANPFIATRYTQRSSLSARSNSTSQRGGAGSGPLRSAGSESRVSPSSPIGRALARAQPRAARAGEQGGDYSRGHIDNETRGSGGGGGGGHYGGGGENSTAVSSSPPREGGQSGRASSNFRRPGSDRSSWRKNRGRGAAAAAAAAAVVDAGSVSDLGVDVGARNAGGGSSSSSRPIFRTMSLRGRSLFSGGPGVAERRSVSMSSFRGRGDSMRADGDYDSVHSWRGGRRGVANRVCSALSVGWLFSRNSGKPKGKDSQDKKKKKKKGKNGGPLAAVLDLSRTSSRRSPYSSAGVVGVMDNGQDGYTSSDEDDGDDIFEIGGPRDIAVGGVGSRQSARSTRAGDDGGGEGTTGERGGNAKGVGKTASEGGTHDTTAAAPAASVNEDGRNRLSFTRSGMLGLDRSTNSSMSSYSFVQHAPSRVTGTAMASNNGGVRANAADPTPGAEGRGGLRANHSTDSSANLTVDGSGGAIQASGNAGRTPAASDRTDGVQYVNFNGHGGRGGGVVALRGAGVATIKTQGDPSVAGMGFSSMVESERRSEVDEEEAKRRMDTLLLRSRVHTHLNPSGAPGAGAPAH